MRSTSYSNHHPMNTFSNFSSAPKDFNRINLMRNGCSIYQLNGGGRDTYIYNNNGGFCKPKEPVKYHTPGKMMSIHGRSKEKFP